MGYHDYVRGNKAQGLRPDDEEYMSKQRDFAYNQKDFDDGVADANLECMKSESRWGDAKYRMSAMADVQGLLPGFEDAPDEMTPEDAFDESVKANKQPENKSGAQREKLHAASYDLVPYQELTDAYVRVAEMGAVKYDAWNWSKGLPRVQILCSLLRHTFAYMRGKDKDKESGLSHADHILWNAVALVHNIEHNLEDGRRAEPPRSYKDE